MSTKTKLKRRLILVNKETGEPLLDKKGNPIFTGGYAPALPKMIEEVVCPCHKKPMTIKVCDGQAINLRKECKRQVENGVRDFKRQELIGHD